MSGSYDAVVFDIKLKVDFVKFLQSLCITIRLNRQIMIRNRSQNRNIRTQLSGDLHIHRTLNRRSLVVPKRDSSDDRTFGIEFSEDSFFVIFYKNFFVINHTILFFDEVERVFGEKILVDFRDKDAIFFKRILRNVGVFPTENLCINRD